MNKHLGQKWVDLRGTQDELDIKNQISKENDILLNADENDDKVNEFVLLCNN